MHLDNHYELCSPAAEEWLDWMTTVHNQILYTLKRINEKRSTFHIEKARQFKIDAYVPLDVRKPQGLAENNKSLTRKWLGLYELRKSIASDAYSLQLPEETRSYNGGHPTLL